jgi:hypothetical protein
MDVDRQILAASDKLININKKTLVIGKIFILQYIVAIKYIIIY